VHETARKLGALFGYEVGTLLQRPAVTAPIIGATKLQHLEDAVGALSVSLTGEEIAALEEPYVPHRIVGFS